MIKKLQRIHCLLACCLFGVTFSLVASADESSKPNVILINADDLGYGDLGSYGATMVLTPNIDKLARDGVRFTDAHSASAVCSPSRYALMTGEYPARANMWGPTRWTERLAINTSKTTIARVMKDADYSTAIIGKWHLGFGSKQPTNWNKALKPGPLELGFDYYFGVPVVNSNPPYVYVENHHVVGLVPEDPLVYGKTAKTRYFDEKSKIENTLGGADAAHALYKDREVGTTLKDKAIDWIKENKSEPFFLYFATTNIHHPFTPAPQFIGTSRAGPYGDYIHELDWMVGELMATLEAEGLAENTMIIFTSDNGGMFNRGGQTAWETGHRINGDLLGMKFGAWEGGHRVPFIVRWPGKIDAGRVSNQLISNVDMLATLAALVERPLKEGEGPDSLNVLPAFTGSSEQAVRDNLIISPFRESHLSIRSGKWVYIPGKNSGGFTGSEIGDHRFAGAAAHKLTKQVNSDIQNGKIKSKAPAAQLYDLQSDPSQSRNVHDEYPEIVAQMKASLVKIMGEN